MRTRIGPENLDEVTVAQGVQRLQRKKVRGGGGQAVPRTPKAKTNSDSETEEFLRTCSSDATMAFLATVKEGSVKTERRKRCYPELDRFRVSLTTKEGKMIKEEFFALDEPRAEANWEDYKKMKYDLLQELEVS